MGNEQRVVLNADTIIHAVRQLNNRGISATEILDNNNVSGLKITRGEVVDRLNFNDTIIFGEGRDVRFEIVPAAAPVEHQAPVVELAEEADEA